ncbi:MAG: HEAT repeat domain-containing protein [Planctomycetia bacterium]|nr:HEAT repeat domain-containing protein [Planctomycetia bacterium]
MRGQRLILLMLVSGLLAETATAGIFSRRKPAAQRVPELIGVLKSDAKERHRADAADELGGLDAQSNPEIIPALLEALRDASADVRVQAVQALGKLRPVRPEVGQALEQAQNGDSSIKVRLQARTALWQYQLAGYRPGKNEGPPINPPTNVSAKPLAPTTQEPPLLQAPATPPARRMPQAAPASRLAPIPAAQPNPMPTFARPLPSGTAKPPLVPTPAPILQTPPSDEGPELNAPM